jgi:two-component system cell cycle sensor histidine kinase/response regulator CckA
LGRQGDEGYAQAAEIRVVNMDSGKELAGQQTFAFEWNPDTDEVRCSGHSADIDVIGFTGDATHVHPEDRERLIQTVRSLTPSNDAYDTEYRVNSTSGQMATFRQNARAFFDSGGRMTRIIGMTANVTGCRAAAAALRESERRYRDVFDNASECIFLLDVTEDGRFKFAGFNPAEEKAVGLSSTEAYGKFVEDVLPAEVANGVIVNYRRCLEAGRLINYEGELNLPIGRRYFHTNLTPVRNAAGRIHRIIGSCLDITHLKRSQEEALVRQKLESVGLLAGGIAHDFNNLLGSILADAELALTDLDPGMPGVEEIEQIKAVALRASEIVRQLMIYAGQETAKLQPVDISSLVDEMLQLLKVSISKHAVLKTDLGKNFPAVLANAAQIRQVVMNLITNASEAIGERNGVIHVSTERVTLPEGEHLRLEVSDTGSGMTAETQAKIFEPFFTTKFAGRGLGMAVVESIVRSHNGAIYVESAPDRGTRIQVFLPCAGQPMEQDRGATVPASAERNPSGAGTLLIVEDEVVLRLAVSKMLRKSGFSVIEASDGSSAVELFRSHRDDIDVILLDVTIPGTSSREVILEAQRIRPDIKIIVTSAYSREMALPTLGEPQIKGFIRKPFSIGDLEHMLSDTLASGRVG